MLSLWLACEAWTVSLFLLPLTVLRQQRHRPDATEIAAFAQMVVIFQVLDALWSAVSDSVTPLEARRLVDELCFVMSTGFQLTQPQQRLVLSLWKFEANVDVGTATRDFTTFSSSFVAEDPDLVVDVIRKCLSWEQFSARSGRQQSSQLSIPRALSCSSKVLTYFTSKANSASSRYLLSPLGAAFMMASALDKDSWEVRFVRQ